MHEFWSMGGQGLHFLLLLSPVASVIGYAGEYNISSVPLGTRLVWRRLVGPPAAGAEEAAVLQAEEAGVHLP